MHKKFKVRCRAIILDQDKLLTVRHVGNTKFVALPGGHLEPGEHADTCIEREIIEELGVKPVLGELAYIHHYDGESGPEVEFIYLVHNGPDFRNLDDKTKTHDHEIEEVVWLSKNSSTSLLPAKIQEDFNDGLLISDTLQYI